MKYVTEEATNVSHLLQLIDGLADATNLVICRGQADAAWRLEPSIDRNIVPGTTYAQRLQEERGIVDDYREGVKNLLPDLETDYLYSENPDDLIKPGTVLQHFGAPTRLLDWTASPHVAAFFAVIERWDKVGTVWWYRQQSFNDAALKERERLGVPDPIALAFDHRRFMFAEGSPAFVIPVLLSVPFPRAAAQQGQFTAASRLGLLHDDLLSDLLHPNDFGRIDIPSALKRETVTALKVRNVTAKSLEHVGADRLGLRLAWERTRRTVAP